MNLINSRYIGKILFFELIQFIKQLGEHFTAHSLRASFVTIAKANGADDLEVMNQTKHRTTTMIQRYDRRRNIRKHNASGKLGL